MTGGPTNSLQQRAAEAKRKAELLLGPHRLVTLKAKRMLAYDPIASPRPRLVERAGNPNVDYIQDPTTGRFQGSHPGGGDGDGGGGTGPVAQAQSAQQQAAGQKTGGKKLFKPSADLAEHATRVVEVLKGKTLRNDNYRYCVKQLIKEAQSFAKAMGSVPSTHTLTALNLKIAESFHLQGALLVGKGQPEKGNPMLAKAAKMGYQPPAGTVVTPTPPPVPAQSKPAGTPDSTWKKIGPQKGSNPGGTYQDAKGQAWYVKTPKTADHVSQDILANRLYMIAGAKVPEEIKTTLDGKPALASKMLPPGAIELGSAGAGTKGQYYKELQAHFAADAWLGNRDVIGLNEDNVLLSGGNAYRVDQGGALEYRAQGEKKVFANDVAEFTSLRNPNLAPQAAKVFGDMTPQQLVDSIDKVLKISDAQILDEASKLGVSQKVANTLIARKADLAAQRQDLLTQIVAAQPQLPPVPKPTVIQADIEKAKKTTAYPANSTTEGNKLIVAFNAKYADKPLTDQAALETKAVEFKEMKAQLDAIKLKDQAASEAALKVQAEKDAQTALGDYGDPNDPVTSKEHFAVLAAIMGGSYYSKSYAEDAKAKLDAMKNKPDMTPIQAACISAYTASHYGAVNKQLRDGSITVEHYNYAKILSSALSKLPDYKGTTNRGTTLTPEQLSKYQVGKLVFERGFTSTSKGSGFSGNVRFVVESKTGKDVSALSQHKSEKEVLFDMNTVFRVSKKEFNTIYLEEV